MIYDEEYRNPIKLVILPGRIVTDSLPIMPSKFLLSLSIYAVTLGVVGDLVNRKVPQPYMDEIFHIPQAQHYCAGNFTHWDNKITTLPGLYLFSVGMLEPVYKLSTTLSLGPQS